MLSWDCGRRCPILARMSAQQFPSRRMFQLHFPQSNHKQMNIIHNCCILRKLTVSLFNSRSNIQRIRIANELSKPFVLHQLKTRVNMQTFYFDVSVETKCSRGLPRLQPSTLRITIPESPSNSGQDTKRRRRIVVSLEESFEDRFHVNNNCMRLYKGVSSSRKHSLFQAFQCLW